MQIEKALLAPVHLRKEEAERIARAATGSKKEFAHLLLLMSAGNLTCSKRAAWCFSLTAALKPGWVDDCQPSLVACLALPDPPDALLRNTLRILRDCIIRPALYDQVAFHCFELVQDPRKAIAIRAFALYILGQIGTAVPEIQSEVKAIMAYYFNEEAVSGQRQHPGLLTAARKVGKAWAKK